MHTLTPSSVDSILKHTSILPQTPVQQEAWHRFLTQGLPTKKHEEYKYTQVEQLVQFLTTGQVVKALPQTRYTYHLDFKYQIPSQGISTTLESPSSLFASPFFDLNTALAQQGARIDITETSEIPFVLYHKVNQTFEQAQHQISIAPHQKATIIHIFEDETPAFSNVVTHIEVGEGAELTYIVLHNAGESSFIHDITNITQASSSTVHTTALSLSGAWVRYSLNIYLNGEQANAYLNGIFLTQGSMLSDHHTLVAHNVPNCYSSETYKGILKDKSTGVFNGKIYVKRDAQQTNAYQSNKNILLSDDAVVNTKPQLEIFANDVKCSHGSTTGSINPDALFYMQARGIGQEQAQTLLLQGVIEEVITAIPKESLHAGLLDLAKKYLA